MISILKGSIVLGQLYERNTSGAKQSSITSSFQAFHISHRMWPTSAFDIEADRQRRLFLSLRMLNNFSYILVVIVFLFLWNFGEQWWWEGKIRADKGLSHKSGIFEKADNTCIHLKEVINEVVNQACRLRRKSK